MLTDEKIDARTRVIAICLEEAEWRAFVGVEPRPVDWVRQQIQTRISTARQQQAAGAGS
jgi:hypothetical protein